MRVMRMRPNRAKNVFIGLTEPADRIKRFRVRRNGDHPPNPAARARSTTASRSRRNQRSRGGSDCQSARGPLCDDLPPLRCNAENRYRAAKTILSQDLGRSRHGRMLLARWTFKRSSSFPSKLHERLRHDGDDTQNFGGHVENGLHTRRIALAFDPRFFAGEIAVGFAHNLQISVKIMCRA